MSDEETDSDNRRLVKPQCHEFDANLNFNQNGLRPYFGLASAVSDGGGSVETTTTFDGETWEVTLRYTEGNLVPPGETTPGGTEWNVGTTDGNVREFRLDVSAGSDELRSASFHVRPRWRGLEGEKSDGTVVSIPVPDSLVADGDALSIRAQGSNIPFDHYPKLLRRAARAVGVTGYLRDLHRTSNVQDAARYLRLDRDRSGPVHSREGPIQSLAHVLENDREGYRRLVQNDTTEAGERLPGYYHTATLGPNRIREVFPDHELPKETKHYYAREALDRPKGDPLAHPKLEVSLQSSRWDGTLGADSDGLAQLVEELDDTLYTIVQDALGESALRAGNGYYVQDDVFTAQNHTTDASPVELNLTEVRHEQERVIYKHLADGMPDTDRGILKTLISDGGTVSPAQLADETARHRDTVYTALDRMDDLLDRNYGEVALRSTYMGELVADAIEEAENAVHSAVDAAGKALAAGSRGLDERTSAFLAWQERYIDQFQDRAKTDGGVCLDLGRVDSSHEVRRLLREGLSLWREMNRDEATFRMGEVKWRRNDERGTHHGTVWKLIRGGNSSGGTKVIRSRR